MGYLYALAVLSGIATAIQPGQNSTLGKALSAPMVAGLVSLSASAAVFVVIGVISGQLALPSTEKLAQAPWWSWFAGVLGALLILSQLYVAERIGAASFLGLSVTAGLLTSILLDHFGAVGFSQHPVSMWRILGGVLMVAGVALVAMF